MVLYVISGLILSRMSGTEQIKTAVKEAYSSLAAKRTATLEQSCCDTSASNADKLLHYGYSREELSELPESVVVMADGCGNPTGLGMVREGETVLDLGSGGHNPLRRVGVVEGASSGREHPETLEVDNLGRQDQNHSDEPLEGKSDGRKPQNCS